MSAVSIEASPSEVDVLQPPDGDRYWHVSFTEREAPDLAVEARRVHALGYLAMNFVHEDAIEPNGTLTPEIDKMRGDKVDYKLAVNLENEGDRASLRKRHLGEGETYADLPGYILAKDAISDLGEAYLKVINPQNLKEIGALARTAEAHPLAVHELFRKIVHEARGRHEIWFMTVVSTTYDSLVKSFGKKNFMSVGDNVPIEDDRVGDQIELKPAVVQADEFIENILLAYQQAKTPKEAYQLRRSFLFMTDTLPREQMSERIFRARQQIKLQSQHTGK